MTRQPNGFLETAHEVNSGRSNSSTDDRRQRPRNPFKIPDEQEYFAMKGEKKRQNEIDRRAMQDSHLYKRSGTSFSRQNYPSQVHSKKTTANISERSRSRSGTDSNQINDCLRDFIRQKREIFVAQLAIDTKREELERLEQIEQEEEQSLRAKEAEINLFRDQFRSFLANDGKATMEARHAAEVKSKERIEISLQIKQVSTQIAALRNEIAHHDEKLQECQAYKDFLEALTPKDWKEEHPGEMYFKDPKQLMNIMISLEEQNMFLIRHCQEAEDAVERYRVKFNNLLESRDGSITEMLQKKDKKKQELNELIEKNEQYKVTRDFKHGNELSPQEMKELQDAISKFHKKLGFENTASPDASSMLKRIEMKMEEVMINLSKLDEAQLKQLTQEKELKRRNEERQQKNEKERKEQEEKTNKALALAMMPIKKKTGRPLVERVIPVKTQSREKLEEEARLRKLQELADAELLYGPIWD